MAEISSQVDLRDPLGAPHMPSGPEYLQALSRLGWNAENLNSNLPFASATMKAASSLITNQYAQQMEYQKDQANVALAMSNARHIDSETDFNNRSLDLRLKDMDLTRMVREQALKSAEATQPLRERMLKDQADASDLDLQTLRQQTQDQLDARSKLKDALAAIPKDPEDPNFKASIDAWQTDNATLLSRPDSIGKQANDALNQVVGRYRNTSRYSQQLAAIKEYEGLQQAGHIESPFQADQRVFSGQPLPELIKGRMLAEQEQLQAIISDPRMPQNYRDYASNVLNYVNRFTSTGDDGVAQVQQGNAGLYFTKEGRLNATAQGIMNTINAARTAKPLEEEAVLPIPGITGRVKGREEPYITTKGTQAQIEERVRQAQQAQAQQTAAEQVAKGVPDTPENLDDKARYQRGEFGPPNSDAAVNELRRRLNERIGQRAAAAQPGAMPPSAQVRQTMEDRAALDPTFRMMMDEADRTGDWAPVYLAMGINPTGMQYGGLVGTRVGLMKQAGGMIFNPATVGAAGSTDTVPAMLSPGEYVVSAPAVAAVGQGTLDQINQAGQTIATSPNISDPLASMSQRMGLTRSQLTRPQTQQPPTGQGGTQQQGAGQQAVTPWYGRQQPQSVSAPGYNPQEALPAAAQAIAAQPGPMGAAPGTFMNPATGSYESLSGAGWKTGIGTEFGEVDNPAYGGYTEAGWNRGRWGDTLSGWDTQGVALPNVPRGTTVEVLNPMNGMTTVTTVKDSGPGAGTGAAIDLLGGTRAALGLPRNFKGQVQYRILSQPGQQQQIASAPGYQEGGEVGYQRGGLVSEEGSIGTRASRGGGEARGGGAGIESELDMPVDPRQRRRRFHPRVGAPDQLGAVAADIPDVMQRKLARLSQDYLGGLSDLIKTKPEMGQQLLRHARRQLASNMGGAPSDWMAEPGIGGAETRQGRLAMPQVPPEAYAGSSVYGGSGEGESAYMRQGGSVGYQMGGAVGGFPEDVMNKSLLDPEGAYGLGAMQRGGLVRPTHHTNLLSRVYEGLVR